MVSPILWYQAAQACLHFVSVKVSGQRAYPFAQLLDENLVNKHVWRKTTENRTRDRATSGDCSRNHLRPARPTPRY